MVRLGTARLSNRYNNRVINQTPLAKIISGSCSSLLVFYLLHKLFPTSKFPAIVLTLMLMASFNFSGVVKNLLQPAMTAERAQIVNALVTLSKYKDVSCARLDNRKYPLDSITTRHKQLTISAGREERFDKLRDRYALNQELLNAIKQFTMEEFSITNAELQFAMPDTNYKVVELLEHLVRDWSDSSSRAELFNPVISALNKHGKGGKAFLPGGGLSRLAFECSKMGYESTAMDMAPTMYIGSRYMLANLDQSHTVYPYVNEFSHVVSADNQLDGVVIPDHHHHQPKTVNSPRLLLGDFMAHREEYDAVITLFFLDTSQNILQYIDAISRLTKPGGIWINYGPLKYGTGAVMELTMEEIKYCIKHGEEWEVLEEWEGTNRYQGHPDSMWQAHYRLHGWVARKRG